MTERGKDTGFWSDPFVQKLPALGKLLFDYLWTNAECNQAGLYHITPTTMAFFTGIYEEEIPDLLTRLEPKVEWWPDLNLVWVKNFLKRQCKSGDFLKAATKCLNQINHSEIVNDFLDYNKSLYERYGVEIPYREKRLQSDTETKVVETKKAPIILPDWINKELWDAFLEMRKKKKASPTDKAVELLIKELEKFKLTGGDPDEILKQSIMKNWTGLFPLKGGQNGAHQRNPRQLTPRDKYTKPEDYHA